MNKFKIEAKDLSKTYDNREWVFKNINILIENGTAIGLTGRNGSGKSTLLKTLSGIIKPTKGKITFSINNSVIDKDKYNHHIGLVAPYLTLYEEFTAIEHIHLYLQLKGISTDDKKTRQFLKTFSLDTADGKYISKFSSGMKQRLKYILAFVTKPNILFLDEPFTNLDENGIKIVENVIQEYLNKNAAIIIASNDQREMKFCKDYIDLTAERE